MTDNHSPAASRAGLTGRGMIAGLLTAAVAVGVGQLAAAIIRPQGSPVAAVGSLAIDFTPPQVKDFAISAFGTHDKLVLVSGILVLLAGFAAWLGTRAVRRFSSGVAGIALFAVVGLLSALTRPGASPLDALPTLLGAAAAILALHRLVLAISPAAPPATAPATPGPAARTASVPQAAAAAGAAVDPDLRPRPGDGASPVPPVGPPPGPPPGPGHRTGPPVPAPDRRRFLVTGSAVAGAAVVAGLIGRELTAGHSVDRVRSALRVPRPARPAPPLPPGTDFRLPGLSPFVTPNGKFYRVDEALVLPQVPPSAWNLRIHGMVQKEIRISFRDLLKRPLIEDWITLCCVSNPVGGPYIGNAKWLGASLASLLREAGIRAGADQIVATSVDGFTSGTPIQAVMDGRDALLAIAMNGSPLPVEHGFPARMVVPGLYGYVSACKWVTDIEVTTFADNHAYWTTRGWDQQAPVKTESRIDIPTGEAPVRPGRVPVAGVAWAQHKGIDAVEVRVDGGPWQEAKLAAVPGIDTWRQWVFEWDATAGSHLIQARATDKTGYTQTGRQAPPPPNGASGYPAVSVTVTGCLC
ncbi:MAG TPA: molybdopterin-dependent oxidoreductase [Streptosporangiaceae bacterium]